MTGRGAIPGLTLVGVLVACLASGEDEAPPPLRLAWLDVEGVTVGVDGVARAECRSVLEEAGLEVVWRRGSGGEQARPGEVRVLVVDHLVVDPHVRRSIMGATPARPRPHPVVWIHVGSVRASLGFPPDFPILDLPLKARRDLGVALGRVVAHEVVHALAPDLSHGSGLMSPMLTRNRLISPHLSLDEGEAERLRAAFRNGPTPGGSETEVLAASGTVEGGRSRR